MSANKKQLIDLICRNVVSDVTCHVQDASSRELMLTPSDDTPTEIHKGQVYLRQELTASNEEADNIIVQQAVRCAKDQPGAVVVVANDTDVFVLLHNHYENEGLASAVFMESPVQQRSTTDVKATVQQHHAVVPGLLCYTCVFRL